MRIHQRMGLLPVSHGSSQQNNRRTQRQIPLIFRANSFTEGTNLFCRLPLSTLFYRPDAVNIRHRMRLLVRLSQDNSDLDFHGSL